MKKTTLILLLATTGILPLTGCAVGQKPGKGQVLHLQDPHTKGWYWAYLPEDYVTQSKSTGGGRASTGKLLTGKKWPLVVTFHGMKPFDNADRQIREWQQEADRYGFVVIAPHLASPDLLAQFPLRTVHPGVMHDEQLTLGAIDEMIRRADVDPNHVLSTSWSSGGYLAHYIVNRHPHRFSCLAPRQSNFSASVLDPNQVPEYRDMKVGIFYTENDLAICRRESQQGAQWYSQRGFDVTFAVFKALGHERRPGASAAFFAQTCGATAKTPPLELATMQVKQVSLPYLAAAQARQPDSKPVSGEKAEPREPNKRIARRNTQRSPAPTHRLAGDNASESDNDPGNNNSDNQPSPTPRRKGVEQNQAETPPLRIRVSSSIGIAPLLINYSAIVPGKLRRGAFFLWTSNGEPISNELTGQKYLIEPGKHKLEVLMTTADGKEYRAEKTITVLERVRNERSTPKTGE